MSLCSIFNIVINKYSILVRTKCFSIQNMCLLFPSGCMGTKNYSHVPNKWEDLKIDQPWPHGVSFCGRG